VGVSEGVAEGVRDGASVGMAVGAVAGEVQADSSTLRITIILAKERIRFMTIYEDHHKRKLTKCQLWESL
jgi:hypothetical protein